jgi:hypothetical protein
LQVERFSYKPDDHSITFYIFVIASEHLKVVKRNAASLSRQTQDICFRQSQTIRVYVFERVDIRIMQSSREKQDSF